MQMMQSNVFDGSSGVSDSSATTVASGFSEFLSSTSIGSIFVVAEPSRIQCLLDLQHRPRMAPGASPWRRRKSSM